MITPKDIHDKEFKRSLRGYDLDDVDQFLDVIIKDLEELYKENASLKEERDIIKKKIDQYSEMEGNLNRALLLAEKTAESVKAEAIAEKDRILDEARTKAGQILDKAKDDAKSFNTVNLDLIEKSENFRKNLVELFEKQISAIKEFGNIEDTVEFKKEIQERVIKEEGQPVKVTEQVSAPELIETRDIIEENFSAEYKEEYDNGLLDEEEEEFKNKVFKFLDK